MQKPGLADVGAGSGTDAMQNYNGNDERSRAVDHVQLSLSCCGVQNYTNWSTSPYFLEHGVPSSCCMNDTYCNPQDLHNLTVAATKVNQKVLAPSRPLGCLEAGSNKICYALKL